MTLPYAEVIGDPIAQSKSPVIHKFWLEKLGIAGDYRKTHITADGLEAFFRERAADPAWKGCNVTVPHKQAVIRFVEDRGGVGDSIGAMNTVIRLDDGTLIGTNTDAAGFYGPIADLDLAGRDVVVIGAGGAARAVLFALSRAAVGEVTILNRTRETGVELLRHFGLKGKVLPLDAPIPPAALIVNASTLGMTGAPDFDPDLSDQPDDCVVYDIVYAPLQTALLAEAEAQGLETVDGLAMLIGQAAVAFELFFDREPPRLFDEELRKLLTA
ncbi:shikimate dehydrogenase [Sphingomonas sp. C3-2]|uniref:shikimate dehydrogenase n=1 Tax=Sphingomonas sp. C3-2 TaxID=3062169 RepID=UPI00294B225E|nr:shikimate dehydrogenase [Sphingomonas sp. C3-2]WOK35178.1 shikimate dehydrogenase [Sphingomonas sp. C3-2]